MEILECQSFKFNCPQHRVRLIEDATLSVEAQTARHKKYFLLHFLHLVFFLCVSYWRLGKGGENFIGKYSDVIWVGLMGASLLVEDAVNLFFVETKWRIYQRLF